MARSYVDAAAPWSLSSATIGGSLAATVGATPDDDAMVLRHQGIRRTYAQLEVPLYHCFGMVAGNLSCSVSGVTMAYPSEAFDPFGCLGAIAEDRCTSLYLRDLASTISAGALTEGAQR